MKNYLDLFQLLKTNEDQFKAAVELIPAEKFDFEELLNYFNHGDSYIQHGSICILLKYFSEKLDYQTLLKANNILFLDEGALKKTQDLLSKIPVEKLSYKTLLVFTKSNSKSVQQPAKLLILKHFPEKITFDDMVPWLRKNNIDDSVDREIMNQVRLLILEYFPKKVDQQTLIKYLDCSDNEVYEKVFALFEKIPSEELCLEEILKSINFNSLSKDNQDRVSNFLHRIPIEKFDQKRILSGNIFFQPGQKKLQFLILNMIPVESLDKAEIEEYLRSLSYKDYDKDRREYIENLLNKIKKHPTKETLEIVSRF